jgi:hypothetical protein
MRTVPSSSWAITGTRPRSSNLTPAMKPSASRGAAAAAAAVFLRADIDASIAEKTFRSDLDGACRPAP